VAARKPRKERATYHHGDLRNALVRAALDTVSTGSVEQITVREVSRRVGVNHRAVYRHFEDLTALLAAVAEEGYRMLLATLEDALEPLKRAGPDRRLEAIGVAYVAFAVDHPAHYRIMFGRRLNEDGRFPQLEALAERAYAVLAGEVRSARPPAAPSSCRSARPSSLSGPSPTASPASSSSAASA
jgi:AcrR family transcriptional regulator